MHAFQLYPLGDSALVIQFGSGIDPKVLVKIKLVSSYLDKHPLLGLIEYVPAFTTLTLYYDPWVVSQQGQLNPYTCMVDLVQQMLQKIRSGKVTAAPDVVEIPVVYGDVFGPDLEFVARHNKLSPEQVISLHTKGKYLVYMIGFVPGFPYLGGLSKKIASPRKETPRTTIPAGSVGIAGTQTGIYPMETPGGWQLIGRTPLQLFDPQRKTPNLLKAGDEVRFVAISAEEYAARKEQVHGT